MKKILKRSAVVAAVILLIPFILYTASSVMSFAVFYISLARTDTGGCIRYYEGVSKGLLWEKNEWHHYVDFKIDISDPQKEWKLVSAPLPSTMWRNTSAPFGTLRATYRWPSNWRDPFPVSSWRICLLSS